MNTHAMDQTLSLEAAHSLHVRAKLILQLKYSHEQQHNIFYLSSSQSFKSQVKPLHWSDFGPRLIDLIDLLVQNIQIQMLNVRAVDGPVGTQIIQKYEFIQIKLE